MAGARYCHMRQWCALCTLQLAVLFGTKASTHICICMVPGLSWCATCHCVLKLFEGAASECTHFGAAAALLAVLLTVCAVLAVRKRRRASKAASDDSSLARDSLTTPSGKSPTAGSMRSASRSRGARAAGAPTSLSNHSRPADLLITSIPENASEKQSESGSEGCQDVHKVSDAGEAGGGASVLDAASGGVAVWEDTALSSDSDPLPDRNAAATGNVLGVQVRWSSLSSIIDGVEAIHGAVQWLLHQSVLCDASCARSGCAVVLARCLQEMLRK